MKFKKGDLVRWNYGFVSSYSIMYVENSYKTMGGQERDLTFVTYFGQEVNIVVIEGLKYTQESLELITSILREEE